MSADTVLTAEPAPARPESRVRAVFSDVRRLLASRSTGVHVEGDTIHLSVAKLSLTGPVLQRTWQVSATAPEAPQMIRHEILQAEANLGPSFTTVASLALNHCFSKTQIAIEGIGNDPAEKQAALVSMLPGTVVPDSCVVQGLNLKVSEKSLTQVWASPRSRVMLGLRTFFEAQVPVDRLEPCPLAALRASYFYAAPAGPGLAVRVLLAAERAVLLLVERRNLVEWKLVRAARPTDLMPIVLTNIRLLEELARQLIGKTPERIELQGLGIGEDAKDQANQLSMACGTSVVAVAGPAFSGDTLAAGLALSGLEDEEDEGPRAPNMAATLQGPPRWLSIIRLGEILILLALTIAMGVWLHSRVADGRRRAETMGRLDPDWARPKTPPQLNQQRGKEFEAVQNLSYYMDNRGLRMTEVMIAIANGVPPDCRFTSVGFGFEGGGRKLMLTLQGPDEVSAIRALRQMPSLKPYFSTWKLSGLKASQDPKATFQVVGRGSGPIRFEPPPSPKPSPGPSPTASPGAKPSGATGSPRPSSAPATKGSPAPPSASPKGQVKR